MALSEGLKSFVDFFKNSFSDGGDDSESEVFGNFGGEYGIEDNLALKHEDDLDSMYPTNVTTRPSRITSRESKVVSMPYKAGEVTVIEPRSFSESAQIVKKLIEKKTVVLHLDLLDKEQSQRTIDFVCGASHALNGSVQKISDAVVIFTPDTIALSVENAQMQSKFAESLWNKPL
jgi:cell division inhibitor SepF